MLWIPTKAQRDLIKSTAERIAARNGLAKSRVELRVNLRYSPQHKNQPSQANYLLIEGVDPSNIFDVTRLDADYQIDYLTKGAELTPNGQLFTELLIADKKEGAMCDYFRVLYNNGSMTIIE